MFYFNDIERYEFYVPQDEIIMASWAKREPTGIHFVGWFPRTELRR